MNGGTSVQQASSEISQAYAKSPRKKMHEALSQIAEGHIAGLDIKKLNNTSVYRIRLGNYRAQFEFLENQNRMVAGKIGIRGDFYK